MLFHWQDNCCRWIVKCSATGPILFRRIGTWRRKDTWKPSLAPLKLGLSIVCALDNDVHITRLIYRIVTAETKPNVRSMAGSKNRIPAETTKLKLEMKCLNLNQMKSSKMFLQRPKLQTKINETQTNRWPLTSSTSSLLGAGRSDETLGRKFTKKRCKLTPSSGENCCSVIGWMDLDVGWGILRTSKT